MENKHRDIKNKIIKPGDKVAFSTRLHLRIGTVISTDAEQQVHIESKEPTSYGHSYCYSNIRPEKILILENKE